MDSPYMTHPAAKGGAGFDWKEPIGGGLEVFAYGSGINDRIGAAMVADDCESHSLGLLEDTRWGERLLEVFVRPVKLACGGTFRRYDFVGPLCATE
ncbi:hypothetical protein AVEN_265018-1 [Araneus ventricosus]|uniref:Uncharacterized protein n=1 Tax=Araneus ventricosus TaxID=182803 RepID=A0A4Y2EHF4_ARAVE|nr:hypothetical protein AVEN_265018-1 [Araneus ventricosus]